MSATLALNNCPTHGTQMVSIDSNGSGVRVAGGKCCGRWQVIKEWTLTPQQWRDLAEEANAVAEQEDARG